MLVFKQKQAASLGIQDVLIDKVSCRLHAQASLAKETQVPNLIIDLAKMGMFVVNNVACIAGLCWRGNISRMFVLFFFFRDLI